MTKARYVLFKIADGVDQAWGTRTLPNSHQSSFTRILAESYDCSGGDAPTIGHRLTETKHDPQSATFNHGGASSTHYRSSPWQVTKVEEYLPNIEGLQDYTEVVICYCDYAPLPDEQNPWVEYDRPIVSLASFGGDEQAFNSFVQSLTDEDKAMYQIVEPMKEPATVG